MSEITNQSQIRVTLKQLSNLLYHFKHTILEKSKFQRLYKKIPLEYQNLMKRIAKDHPEIFKTNRVGYMDLINFKEEDEPGRHFHNLLFPPTKD